MIPKELTAPLLQSKPDSSSLESKGSEEPGDQPLTPDVPVAVFEIVSEQQNIALMTFEASAPSSDELGDAVASSGETEQKDPVVSSDRTTEEEEEVPPSDEVEMRAVMDLMTSIEEQVVGLQPPTATDEGSLPCPHLIEVFDMVECFPNAAPKVADALSGVPNLIFQDFSGEDCDEVEHLVGYLDPHQPDLSPVIEETEELIFAEMMASDSQLPPTSIEKDGEIKVDQTELQAEPLTEPRDDLIIETQDKWDDKPETGETQREPEANLTAKPQDKPEIELEAELVTRLDAVVEDKLEIEPKTGPEAKSEIEPAVELKTELEGKLDTGIAIEPEAIPEIGSEVIPEDKPETEPEGKPETGSEDKLENEPEGKLETEPEGKPETEPEDKLETEPEGKPDTEPEDKLENEPEGKLETEPEGKPETGPETEPKMLQEDVPEVEPDSKLQGEKELKTFSLTFN